jgi:Spy/CpxP family protein refolding chaperone
MRTTIRLIGFIALSVGLLIGQGPMGRQGGNGQQANQQHDPARKVAHLTVVLDLTEDQAAAANKIFAAVCENPQERQAQMAELRNQWQEAIRQNRVGDINGLAQQWAELMANRRAAQAERQAEFYQILTEAQRQKIDELERMGMGMHGRRGGPGGGRGTGPAQDGECQQQQ